MTVRAVHSLASILLIGAATSPAAMALQATAPAAAPMTMDTNIQQADIIAAQHVWCQALLNISKA